MRTCTPCWSTRASRPWRQCTSKRSGVLISQLVSTGKRPMTAGSGAGLSKRWTPPSAATPGQSECFARARTPGESWRTASACTEPTTTTHRCRKLLVRISADLSEASCGIFPTLTYNMLDNTTEPDRECRELSIMVLRHLAKMCADGREVLEMKESIVTTGLQRIEQMRRLHRQNSNASETERADEERTCGRN